ncbi:MAG: hypothetical protein V1794_03700 [Candidatus Glassbacteria bacterium]
MKKTGPASFILYLAIALSPVSARCAEIGFSFGPYFKANDIVYHPGPAGIDQERTDIFTRFDNPLMNSGFQQVNMRYNSPGGICTATYIGMTYVHNLPVSGFEAEYDFGLADRADQAAKPSTLMFASYVNYVLPWYPPFFLWRVKPFLGAGLGYAYIFGNSYTGSSSQSFNSIPNYGSIGFNFGGGGKIQIRENWWLRLTLRDNLLLRAKRLVNNPNPDLPPPGGPVPSIYGLERQLTHNPAFLVTFIIIK